jgi:hypothetical protein
MKLLDALRIYRQSHLAGIGGIEREKGISDRRKKLYQEATAQYGQIQPCGMKSSLAECFTEGDGLLILWFNDGKGDTHVVSEGCAKN